ncbi:MAG: hypothetical protein K5888_00215 [Lachnospiraceae bacterium]|nr:hypothetical protein [Lachnospiraceae bacterium]
MSDENLNNNGQEETAALFVNAQKRKKAEEEARRKAAEEQARRDAAEAEVRRMEQEVEEARRKAEEERIAREEAEKLRAQQALKDSIKEGIKDAINVKIPIPGKGDKAEDAEGKKKVKLPLILAIAGGALALIAIVVVAIILIKSKGKVVDYASLDAEGTYESDADGYKIKLAYPDTVYAEIEEDEDDGVLSLSFIKDKKNKKAPDIFITLTKVGGTVYQKQLDAKTTWDDIVNLGKQAVADCELLEEEYSELSGEPGKYGYRATFVMDDGVTSGSCALWYEFNESGEAVIVTAMSTQKDKKLERGVEAAASMMDLFVSENAKDALKMPGGNPPEKLDWDGYIGVESIDAKMPISKDRFFEIPKYSEEGGKVWVDDNGAVVVIAGETIGYAEDFSVNEEETEQFKEVFKQLSSYGVEDQLPIEGRTKTTETDSPQGYIDYSLEYNETFNGIPYWERDYYVIWEGKDYEYILFVYTYVPESNKEQYKDIFDRSLKDLDVY